MAFKWLQDKGKPSQRTGADEGSLRRDDDLWSRDVGNHFRGQFSYAVVRSNPAAMEDYSQVETHMNATYVGVYDGHGGSEASLFVRDHLFNHIVTRLVPRHGDISKGLIEDAFSDTEGGFLDLVRIQLRDKPHIATVGSCCLVGIILGETLYVANLGVSRAVLGHVDGHHRITADQLTTDHDANIGPVREDLWALNHHDRHIVVEVRKDQWRVKGYSQITRSIGDAYLKKAEFDPDRKYLPKPLKKPALSAIPAINVRTLGQHDRFVIFASAGLWEYITNQKAVEIVNKSPREGAAKRLLQKAMARATGKWKTRYRKILKLKDGERRSCDITVIILFIDHDLQEENRTRVSAVSVKAYSDEDAESAFDTLQVRNEGPAASGEGESSRQNKASGSSSNRGG